jgi:hypothetical protein
MSLSAFCRSFVPRRPLLLLLAAMSLAVGCDRGQSTRSPASDVNARRTRVDHLALAIDYLNSDRRLDSRTFAADLTRILNQWSRDSTVTVDWQRDPMSAEWTGPLAAEVASVVESTEFLESDARYLREQAWAKGIVDWIPSRQRPADYRTMLGELTASLSPAQLESIRQSPTPLAELLALRYPRLDATQAKQLARVWGAFDWTVRNIQLDELRDAPGDDEVAVGMLTETRRDLPAQMGVPGPGYTLHVDSVLAYGHGDAWQRGRAFLSLLHAMDIDGAFLAIAPADAAATTTPPRPWAVAARIGDELFLFDPALGLPIPTAAVDGIATWNDVRNDPTLLRKLDVAEFERPGRATRRLDYPVATEDLSRVIALLDIAPSALTSRMARLEASLTGAVRLELTRRPSEEATRWRTIEGLAGVALWEVPVLTVAYRRTFEAAVRYQNEKVLGPFLMTEQSYEMGGLQNGRHLALIGRFEPVERYGSPKGAKEVYLSLRFSEEFIDSLDTNEERRQAFGIDLDGRMTTDDRNRTISILKQQLRMVRTVSALWMGIAHYETGDPGSSRQWLSQVEEFDTQELWAPARRYNEARALESLGKFDEAARELLSASGPQEAGDALRARWLFALGKRREASEAGAAASEVAAPMNTETTDAAPDDTPIDDRGNAGGDGGNGA